MHPLADQAAAAQAVLEWDMLQHKLENLLWQKRDARHGAKQRCSLNNRLRRLHSFSFVPTLKIKGGKSVQLEYARGDCK
jgi:hypothetical protein